jgi:glycosyltransferase involved in cell wall biosynthesis
MSKLSVIVPIYNEFRQLENVTRMLFKSPCQIEREWIFIDDCSTDGSLEILKRLAAEFPMRVLEQNPNQGKGAAVIRGIREATGDFIIIQDADFEYDPNDIPDLIEPLLTGKADVVYGSRFKKNSPQVHRTYHYFVNRLLTTMSNLLSGIYLTDMETCYKVFRREIVQSMKLRSRRFGIEVEFTAYLGKIKTRVYELPVSYYPRSYLQGKKITWKDGVAAVVHLIRFNWFTSYDKAFSGLPERYLPR